MKDYFLKLIETVAPEDGALQDAIEYGLCENRVRLTGDLAVDLRRVAARLPDLRAAYARSQARHEALLDQLFGPAHQPGERLAA